MAVRMIKVLHVSESDGAGGAARAAFRVHRALRSVEQETGVSSHMLVREKTTSDSNVITIARQRGDTAKNQVFGVVARAERRLFSTENRIIHSTARNSSSGLKQIVEFEPDAIVLHWLGNSVLSVEQVGRLSRSATPVYWILHDTWAFSGAEHYPHSELDRRFVEGYRSSNRPGWESGLDVNRRTWERKRRRWTQPIHIIAPSHWMADLVGASSLMGSWPVEVVPYPMDLAWWGGLKRDAVRDELRIGRNERIILFGAVRGEKDPRKGADLLRRALYLLSERLPEEARRNLTVLTFGGTERTEHFADLTIRSIGRLNDEGLRQFYTAADVVVVPSRMDNLPQTAVEAIACGAPVVGFRIGGMPDIVVDGVSGRLVEPFSTDALANAMAWVFTDNQRRAELSEGARLSAARWSQGAIALRLAALFRLRCTAAKEDS